MILTYCINIGWFISTLNYFYGIILKFVMCFMLHPDIYCEIRTRTISHGYLLEVSPEENPWYSLFDACLNELLDSLKWGKSYLCLTVGLTL